MLARLPFLFDKTLRFLTLGLCQVLLVTMFLPNNAQAFEPFVVSDIRVEGMQRTEPGSILLSFLLRSVKDLQKISRQSPSESSMQQVCMPTFESRLLTALLWSLCKSVLRLRPLLLPA